MADDRCPVHDREWSHGRNMANAPEGRYCPWDGSMHPDEFMGWLEKPGTCLTPTDKNYKVYIDVSAVEAGEDPGELKPMILGTGDPAKSGYPDARRPSRKEKKQLGWDGHKDDRWVVWGERGERRESKFYFEHLNDDQKKRFIEMLIDGRLTLREPGFFYRTPFFISHT